MKHDRRPGPRFENERQTETNLAQSTRGSGKSFERMFINGVLTEALIKHGHFYGGTETAKPGKDSFFWRWEQGAKVLFGNYMMIPPFEGALFLVCSFSFFLYI